MIHQLATRHQKKGALTLFAIFYLELVLPNIANAFGGRKYNSVRQNSYTSFYSFDSDKRPDTERQNNLAEFNSNRIIQRFSPTKGFKATIGGPGQPEMSSFKSVNSNEMVDLFTGDFSYNIPLMDVGGYPVSLHYSSNVSMDQEASWVGLGWNLNPGAVNRTMRGLPDDFDGTDTISKTQSIKPNRTVGVTVSPDLEVFGLPHGLSASLGIFHNTYNGWGVETGINASINSGSSAKGPLTGGLGLTSNTQNGLNISPSLGLKVWSGGTDENGRSVSLGLNTNYNSRAGISALQLSAEYRTTQKRFEKDRDDNNVLVAEGSGGTSFPSAGISFVIPSYTPTISFPFTSTQYFFRAKIGTAHVGLHPTPFAIEGYISTQEIKGGDTIQKLPAAGYLYFTGSNDHGNILQDFNREKELPFNEKTTPHLAIPQYTYDVYSISGEGTGGMFRPYRGDVGYVRDYTVKTKSGNQKYAIDLGGGQIFHGGVDLSNTNTITENNSWTGQNDINQYLNFRASDTTYQAVYFRNPGEMTSNSAAYYQSIGDDNLLRVKLTGDKNAVRAANSFLTFKNGKQVSEIQVTGSIVKNERDKRSQVISYLTAQDASVYGLDKNIISYAENAIPVGGCSDNFSAYPRVDGSLRKGHHLSEITVLNSDGRRYIYGLPAYNVDQEDVTFSVDKQLDANGLTSYTKGSDNSVSNGRGKDGYYTREKVPGYAHSFLLTGIVSPDYVDIKGDGITQDDIGDAVKFNYTRVYGNNGDYFNWRTPADSVKANYNQGLKSYSRDDKATYIFGKKEVWYLNSIESKTMVAVLKISSDRKDVYSVRDENGGLDKNKPLRKLDSIFLYSKSDLVKNGSNAKPIKTVIFKYSYTLCKGVTGDTTSGKLTLDSLWFAYNGNYKGKLNPYVFKYHGGDTSYNPKYQQKCYDRWGNFKYPTNPGGLSNVDYPFTDQNKTNSDKYAQMWTMDEILLPSGGRIKATYEADDYAYVQNRRAQQFFSISGVSNSLADTSSNNLYSVSNGSWTDNSYVFVHSDVPLTNTQDLYEKYLRGINYLYFKLSVTVPTDKWGGGTEIIPVYGQIDSYGLLNANKFWIRLKMVDNNQGALARSAVQFLRLNLSSKAYPFSEPGDNIGVWDAVKMLATSFKQIKDGLKNFDNAARLAHRCQTITLSQSFIRLDCPYYKKLGGGLRVKRIEVYDNWNHMTGQKESVYGQDYNYTKTEKINGQDVVISSGVASYEPMIGAEENPFREPIPYAEKLAPMAPVNNLFSEEPLGESYYPSASVGYSKVRVRTINTKAKSVNGWAETEYFTTKDFPTIIENTIIDPSSKKQYNPALQNFLKINEVHYLTLSQGFKIELNDMNGKVKGLASYAETDSIHPISYTKNYYKVDNDTAFQKHLNNTVWLVDSLNGHINQNGTIGKDIEVIQDMREQTSRTIANNQSANVDILPGIGIIPFIPIATVFPLPQKEENRFRSSVTVKVVQRYGILDSLVVMDKGSIVSTKNLVYDGETGQVVLSRTNNEFNDPVYNFSYPAHWAYSGMGVAYKNIDAVFTNLKLIRGKLYYGNSTDPFPTEKFFESGDVLKLVGKHRSILTGINCLAFSVKPIGTHFPDLPLQNTAWVIDAAKAKQGGKGLYFIDKDGAEITGQVDTIRVLRSGKRNLLDASVGSIVSLSSPIKEVTSGNFKLVFDTTTKIVNTSAVTYKDHWKVENNLYAKDTTYSVLKDATPLNLFAQVVTKKLRIKGTNTELENSWQDPSGLMVTSFDRVTASTCANSQRFWSKSIATYSQLSNIPSNAVVTSATITFSQKNPQSLWQRYKISGGIFCSDHYSYNWPGATSYYLNSSLSYLRRITAPWNDATPYRSMQTTETNKVSVDYNSYTNVNCTNLIQDIVTSGNNYGVSFELNKQDASSGSETDYLSFEGGGTRTLEYVTTGPVLTVNYRTYQDSSATLCKQQITDTLTNPYRWGILGNWRVDRAYTFYHDRKESDASDSTTNIRTYGTLKAFSSFWRFTDSGLVQNADTTKWVWNSASSLYNKKGFEIENYDPLGRYNAGLYGYDQTLPIAVAQNSRYREILYDGFEDYNYKTKQCLTCPNPREIDFITGRSGVAVDSTQSHTGNYSMKITANSSGYFGGPVVASDTNDSISLSVPIDTVYTIKVPGAGNGLTGYYTGATLSNCSSFLPPANLRDTVQNQGPINFNWSGGSPVSGMCKNWFSVVWKGSLQAPYDDNYHFYAVSDLGVQVYVNNVLVAKSLKPNVEGSGTVINLQAGHLYTITVAYTHILSASSYVRLRWMRENTSSGIEVIPKQFLYKDNLTTSDTSGSVISNIDHFCYKPSNVGSTNIIRPTFSLLPNAKYTVSAWVKMDGNDCNTVPALDSVVVATIYRPWGQPIYLQRTGVRIEGWQRYEATLTMPAEGTGLVVSATAPSDRSIYVDDIRVQPFNSQMKSYAYDQSTLRLMAELDENNYATFYEYDDDGTLIRVKKETERGVMTIKETRSALLKN